MEFISVSEASKQWGVSLRQVQRLLAGERIPHAKKYGRSWMIPADAKKPINPRKEKKLPNQLLAEELYAILASTSIPMPSKHPDAILDSLKDERLRLPYESELAYLRGNFEETMLCFQKTKEDDTTRLRISYMAIAAAISEGDYKAYTEIEEYLKEYIKDGSQRDLYYVAELALSAVAVSVIAPNMAPNWLKEGDFSALAPQLRPIALYLRAKYFQCIGKFDAMLAVAETALSLCQAQQGITLTDLYLHMACAVACYCLEQREESRRWLLKAMNLALPHGFITPFAENVTALGGLVEECLKVNFPDCYDAVLMQCERTFKNWIAFHNLFTKNNITLILSLREYHIALLVVHRVPYTKIATQYDISVGRLKNIMLEIYGKLLISGRDELSNYLITTRN